MEISFNKAFNSNFEIKKERIESIDFLRGVVMVLMILDHVRYYWGNYGFDPLDLSQTTFAIFMTRWITHFCAPLFVFLAGTSAFLFLKSGKTKKELSSYLFLRGLILILLEIFYFSRLWKVSLNFYLIQVIWVLGWGMIILSVLIWLPKWFIFLFGVINVVGHNLLDNIVFSNSSFFNIIWAFIHNPQIIILENSRIEITYTLIPWVGVMALGFIFGNIFYLEKSQRVKAIFNIGISLTIAFILIRLTNFYGDPIQWSIQDNPLFSFLSFINCEKYPPSFLFLLMTLGPGIILLGFLEKKKTYSISPIITFGKVPLFYYILHLPLIYLFFIPDAILIHGLSINELSSGDFQSFGIVRIYLAWIVVVASLYLPCKLYSNIKRTKSWRWLKYI